MKRNFTRCWQRREMTKTLNFARLFFRAAQQKRIILKKRFFNIYFSRCTSCFHASSLWQAFRCTILHFALSFSIQSIVRQTVFQSPFSSDHTLPVTVIKIHIQFSTDICWWRRQQHQNAQHSTKKCINKHTQWRGKNSIENAFSINNWKTFYMRCFGSF